MIFAFIFMIRKTDKYLPIVSSFVFLPFLKPLIHWDFMWGHGCVFFKVI